MTTVTMIDYGGSNVRSVQKALEHVGATAVLTEDPDDVRRAGRLVLPGVGAFGAGMDGLRARGLPAAIGEAAAGGTPLLGICLGLQLLFARSNEMGDHEGLGLLAGDVTGFDRTALAAAGYKVPHMGWNEIEPTRAGAGHPVLAGVPPNAHAYFVHSYYCRPADPDVVLAHAVFGAPFAAIVGRNNIVGIQFHPEKSHQVGLRILRNFLEWTP